MISPFFDLAKLNLSDCICHLFLTGQSLTVAVLEHCHSPIGVLGLYFSYKAFMVVVFFHLCGSGSQG